MYPTRSDLRARETRGKASLMELPTPPSAEGSAFTPSNLATWHEQEEILTLKL